MKLTEEQKTYLNFICGGKDNWSLNTEGKIDVKSHVERFRYNATCNDESNVIPFKFGTVRGDFVYANYNLSTLKNLPQVINGNLYINNCGLTTLDYLPERISGYIFLSNNNLADYFKNIKEEDFSHWDKFLSPSNFLSEYPYVINIFKKYITRDDLKYSIGQNPEIKLYLN